MRFPMWAEMSPIRGVVGCIDLNFNTCKINGQNKYYKRMKIVYKSLYIVRKLIKYILHHL